MTRFIASASLCALLLFSATWGLCSTFDERLWERYAEIVTTYDGGNGSLVGVYLEPRQLGEVNVGNPFADVRVVTEQRVEVPWQIIARRPENLNEEIPARMRNLSRTGKGDTWLELLMDGQTPVNAVEIDSPDNDFSRQVEVLGGNDGKTWNTLRKDGIIFDVDRGEKLRHTRVGFPQTGFNHLALKISNGGGRPLSITGVKVLRENDSQGQTYTIAGKMEPPQVNAQRKESSIVVHMNTAFPLNRLFITTADRNFQRSVEVQIKRDNRNWERWAQGTVFRFDTPTLPESQLAIEIPEVASKDFRLVFKNFDSPPLNVTSAYGEGYRRLLVFKKQAGQKLFLFWGNNLAQQPLYDLAAPVAKQKLDELPMATIGQARPNGKFAGNNARLPFSERYKYLLSLVVAIAIAGLILVQCRVIGKVEG